MTLKMKYRVLFVCVENSCRSQISEGLARHLGSNILEVWSAGSIPSGEIHPLAIQVLKEKGINASHQKSKGLRELPSYEWDYIVTMGCGDACPHLPAKHRLDWNLADPKGQPIEAFRKTRDEIEKQIQSLIKEIRATASTSR